MSTPESLATAAREVYEYAEGIRHEQRQGGHSGMSAALVLKYLNPVRDQFLPPKAKPAVAKAEAEQSPSSPPVLPEGAAEASASMGGVIAFVRKWQHATCGLGLKNELVHSTHCDEAARILSFLEAKPAERSEAEQSPKPSEGWTGRKCEKCKGSGQDNDGRNCLACAGTGDEYGPIPAPQSLVMPGKGEQFPSSPAPVDEEFANGLDMKIVLILERFYNDDRYYMGEATKDIRALFALPTDTPSREGR